MFAKNAVRSRTNCLSVIPADVSFARIVVALFNVMTAGKESRNEKHLIGAINF